MADVVDFSTTALFVERNWGWEWGWTSACGWAQWLFPLTIYGVYGFLFPLDILLYTYLRSIYVEAPKAHIKTGEVILSTRYDLIRAALLFLIHCSVNGIPVWCTPYEDPHQPD